MNVTRCACGRRMSQYANRCKTCHAEISARVHAETAAVVQTGNCPLCGSGLRRNLALTGWWQCDRIAQGCSWQGFTS